MEANARLPGIQVLRALAALLVVWVHTIPAHFSLPSATSHIYWYDFGSCGVDIFFVISGFIVSQAAARAESARHFLVRRFTRIYPLYWVLTSILLAGGLALHQVDGIHRVWWIPTLLLLPTYAYPANPPLLYLGWTLLFEMYFYLVLALFLTWSRRSVIRNTVLFFCAMAGAGLILGIRHPLLVIWMNPLILEFIFGCVIQLWFQHGHRVPAPRTGKTITLAAAVLLSATLLAGPHPAVQLSSVFAGEHCLSRVTEWGIPAAMLVGGVIVWAPALQSPAGRRMVFLGNASYSIYLCTIPALWLARIGWRMLGPPYPALGMALDAVWATTMGVGCYLFLEKPLTQLFHASRPPSGAGLLVPTR